MTEEYPIVVTEVSIRKLESHGRAMATASITLNGSFVVHGLRVIQAENEKCFVAMPSKHNNKAGFSDIAHPINKEVRKNIEKSILESYYEL